MKRRVPQYVNEDNLQYFCSLLSSIEHFVFFGTLLGLVRDNSTIDGDDDIDFYVHARDREALLAAIKAANFGKSINIIEDTTPYFLSVSRTVDDEDGIVDFYFYRSDDSSDYIWDKWNFSGHYKSKANAMKVPKSMIFPIEQKSYKGKFVNMPNNASEVCEYLYGKNWRRPLVKKRQYITRMINNIPFIFNGNMIGRFTLFIFRVLSKVRLINMN